MSTSQDEIAELVTAVGVQCDDNTLRVLLSDGRQVSLPLDTLGWLNWLYAASAEQRDAWTIEPGGYAIYWEDLDDGIEVAHLLGLQPLA